MLTPVILLNAVIIWLMYQPKYQITNKILKYVGAVEAAKEVIENAPLVPMYEKSFKTDAMVRTIYHGTQIEGNGLSLDQAQRVLEGEQVVAGERDVQEVINYRNVMRYLDELLGKGEQYSLPQLMEIHRQTVHRLISEERMGVVRSTQVVIKQGDTGQIVLTPPPFLEVPYLLGQFYEWLNSEEAEPVHPVLKAGITHYILVAIHPFVEGNGRTARAYAMYVMLREGYDIKRFLSLEEHFDGDVARYYEALGRVDRGHGQLLERDITAWLEYFCEVVATELEKIKERIRKLSLDSKIKMRIGQQVSLTERQMRLLEYMSDRGGARMQELKDVLPMVSEDTILRDVKQLLEKNIIKKEGSTKASRYLLQNAMGQ